MSESVIIQNLSMNYPGVKALDGISCTVNKGEIFGFIGPDGAGKTTLFRILTSLLIPDEGTATVDGDDVVKDYKSIRAKVGYMPGKFSLYQDLSVEENLKFFAGVFNTTIAENYHLIEGIYKQIEPFKHRLAGNLSGGMKQKLALSCALIHKPVVLFLDEPTTGVDAVSRKEFWEMLHQLKSTGLTIIVSTPYMDEAALCDRVALLQNGKILSIASPEEIVAEFPHKLYGIKSEKLYPLNELFKLEKQVHSTYLFGDSIHLVLQQNASIDVLMEKIKAENFDDLEWEIISPDIEDCFMELMHKT
ncbi:MAG: ABC transporter ATP-binding protein [Bacteroidales bacterium]|jgi:ABC-type multidrug transport system ATPase subunit|nr:ABC transporter ATP-binding protein [Bacteroidales bacterium]